MIDSLKMGYIWHKHKKSFNWTETEVTAVLNSTFEIKNEHLDHI